MHHAVNKKRVFIRGESFGWNGKLRKIVVEFGKNGQLMCFIGLTIGFMVDIPVENGVDMSNGDDDYYEPWFEKTRASYTVYPIGT